MVIMDPYEGEALVRFTAFVSNRGLTSKPNTLMDTSTSLNFVSKELVTDNGFYKKCKTTPKPSIRVAKEKRTFTTNMFCPSAFAIDGYKFTVL